MLRLWAFSTTSITNIQQRRNFRGVLREAAEIAVTQHINGDYTLAFKYPRNGEFADMRPNAIVECEGQMFRIKRIVRTTEPRMSIECEHIFNCDAKRLHLPNVASTDSGDFIGEDAYSVLEAIRDGYKASSGNDFPFTLIDDEELEELGMKRIEMNIDFDSTDKISFYDAVLKIIECAGRGELYVDNYGMAIVERLGKNTKVVLNTGLNMTNITVERDTSEIITQLYPYGKDDLTIGAAEKNTDSTNYIISNNAGTYGVIEGYRDYSDCTDVGKLYERALWEFDEENPNRLDVPIVNISGNIVDLSRIGKNIDTVRIGDTVRVIDNGEEFMERVISITRNPFEAIEDSVNIGRVKKDMFFYLNQIGLLTKRYKSVSTNDGRIQGAKVSGFSIKDGELYYKGKKIVTEV